MIKDYASHIASQMKVQLSNTTVIDGVIFGCPEVHVLKLTITDNFVYV
jgi:hypothetical protein